MPCFDVVRVVFPGTVIMAGAGVWHRQHGLWSHQHGQKSLPFDAWLSTLVVREVTVQLQSGLHTA